MKRLRLQHATALVCSGPQPPTSQLAAHSTARAFGSTHNLFRRSGNYHHHPSVISQHLNRLNHSLTSQCPTRLQSQVCLLPVCGVRGVHTTACLPISGYQCHHPTPLLGDAHLTPTTLTDTLNRKIRILKGNVIFYIVRIIIHCTC